LSVDDALAPAADREEMGRTARRAQVRHRMALNLVQQIPDRQAA
jgi:hypothetical protein